MAIAELQITGGREWETAAGFHPHVPEIDCVPGYGEGHDISDVHFEYGNEGGTLEFACIVIK